MITPNKKQLHRHTPCLSAGYVGLSCDRPGLGRKAKKGSGAGDPPHRGTSLDTQVGLGKGPGHGSCLRLIWSRKDSFIIFLEAKTNYHSPSAFATYPSAVQGALCSLAVRERSSQLFIVNVLCTTHSARGGQKRGLELLEPELTFLAAMWVIWKSNKCP